MRNKGKKLEMDKEPTENGQRITTKFYEMTQISGVAHTRELLVWSMSQYSTLSTPVAPLPFLLLISVLWELVTETASSCTMYCSSFTLVRLYQ